MTTAPKQRPPAEPMGGEGPGMSTAEMSYAWRLLDAKQREYVKALYDRFRRFTQLATIAYNKRMDRLQWLLLYCKQNNFTDFNTREKIINDWEFSDANDDWLRCLREAQRCKDALELELKMSLLFNGATSVG